MSAAQTIVINALAYLRPQIERGSGDRWLCTLVPAPGGSEPGAVGSGVSAKAAEKLAWAVALRDLADWLES